MKTKQIKTTTKPGPWATVSESQVKQVQDAVEGITGIAVEYKYNTDAKDEVPVDELIDAFAELAGFAYVSLLLLKSTRSKRIEKCKPGPLAHITRAKANYLRKLFEKVQELAVDGLNWAKDKQKIRPNDFFGHFSMIKKYGMELEGFFESGNEDEAA